MNDWSAGTINGTALEALVQEIRRGKPWALSYNGKNSLIKRPGETASEIR